jgi:stage III sporulation protein AA
MNIKKKVDDLTALLNKLPKRIGDYLKQSEQLDSLVEVVMDLGRIPEARFIHQNVRLKELTEVTAEDIHIVTKNIGHFNADNRGGIERTLHRVSCIRNRNNDIVGLTCRVGRAVYGTIEIIRDIIESGHNCLFLGPPGIGKTTLLRETARVLADEVGKRVIVVDTSNEIAGDGDIAHFGIGYSRRIQVPSPDRQHMVMIEAVENHTPEVIIVDEIGTEEETKAARTIAERGVQLVATAHGYTLENIIKNPTISDLLGGVQSVVLGDEEAKFRGTNKSVLERKTKPTFDVLIEIKSRDIFLIYNAVASYVDDFLRNDIRQPEQRIREDNNDVTIDRKLTPAPAPEMTVEPIIQSNNTLESISIFPFGITHQQVKNAAHSLGVPAQLAYEISDADIILTTKAKEKQQKKKLSQLTKDRDISIHVIPDEHAIQKFLKEYYKIPDTQDVLEKEACNDVKIACRRALNECRVIELSPQSKYLRQLQHREARRLGLNSMSVGQEPNRRIRVYPKGD